jgi:hypothetical protein
MSKVRVSLGTMSIDIRAGAGGRQGQAICQSFGSIQIVVFAAGNRAAPAREVGICWLGGRAS